VEGIPPGIYVTVYEGDRSGKGKVTRDGWQENRKLASYLDEVRYSAVAYTGVNTTLQLTVGLIPAQEQLGTALDVTDLVELDRYVIVLASDGRTLEQDERAFPTVQSASVIFTELREEPARAADGSFSIVFIGGATMRGGFAP